MKHFSYCKYIVSVILEASILFVSVQISLLVGFLLGKSRNLHATYQIDAIQPEKSFLSQSKQAASKKEVKIDNSTFVTKTNESQLKGTGEELGSQTIVSDDVSSSVSKLAQLKRNK